ncbi:polysaccharide export protein [Billgrantia kenyensis]|uniref:Polysaccharide biosynthesis/export family protein n=1 Tax=Billgrantia kenyensis TaxID=321266 RepID=A0A7V9W0A7_9GAMM|nr:polysaccharide export protein [Halomonas kenyensis]MBA2778684.1 polysaccharide biosynthesis/export family protein [Halomonas kenyensis]MCG6661746.1 polysaccharide export protein Wza [Halomonas kenyensis]
MGILRRNLAWYLFAVISLSGCALAPGGNITYDADPPDIDHLVDIQAITPELVSRYRREVNGDIASLMPPQLRTEIDEYEYLVGRSDVLSITVYDHPELTIPAGGERSAEEAGHVVQRDGSIFYPYIGRVHVEGRTVEDIRRILTSRLSQYISDPQLEVRVAGYRSKRVYISGAVGSPGTLPVTNEPMTVLDAISAVGGASDSANWHQVVLNRDGRKEELSLYALLRQGDQTQNRLLKDGDVVHVPTLETQNVAVLGQVRSPGNLTLGNERITLTDAIARAGGVVETAARPSGIFVIRTQPEESDKIATVYQLDISNATALTMGTHFPLQPQDVVYVTAAPIARWNTVISLLLPSAILPGTVVDVSSDIGEL